MAIMRCVSGTIGIIDFDLVGKAAIRLSVLVLAEIRRRASTWRSFVIHPHSNVKLHITVFYSKQASVVNN